MKGSVTLTEENRQIVGLQIRNGVIEDPIAVEITCDACNRTSICPLIFPRQKCASASAEVCREAISFSIDHEQVAMAITVEIGKRG